MSRLTIGLLPAPGLPETLAGVIAAELPGLLARHVEHRVDWNIAVVCEPLTGSETEAPAILDVCHAWLVKAHWDFAVCLTDLPVHRTGRIVVADASVSRCVAGVSLSALGMLRIRQRARDAVVHLVDEMYWMAPHRQASRERSLERSTVARHRLAQIGRRLEPADDDMDIDVRFVAPRLWGHFRLLSGMAFANRPWKLFFAFRRAMAAAFATATYALVMTDIWRLGDVSGWLRLSVLTFLSMGSTMIWIVLAHDLWEPTTGRRARHLCLLYNASTVVTLMATVSAIYAGLFALVLAAATLFVPEGLFRTTLQHPVGLPDYLELAWITTSLATFAGALGSSLEDANTVHETAFRHRQRHRTEQGRADPHANAINGA